MVDKNDFGFAGYVLGVLSIVSAIALIPNFGLVFGISGFIFSLKQKTDLSKKAKRLNIIGIILSIVVIIGYAYLSIYLKTIGGVY